MEKLNIPDDFKLLTHSASVVGDRWKMRPGGGGYELLSVPVVNSVALPATLGLILVFGAVMLQVAAKLGGNVPGWVPWVFFSGMTLCALGLLAYQIHAKRNNKPWLFVDTTKCQIVRMEFPPIRVDFAVVRRVHLASESLLDHGEGRRTRHFELSLLVRESEEGELRRIPLIEGLDRKLMLEVSVTLQKALGFRSGSIEDAIDEDELESEKARA